MIRLINKLTGNNMWVADDRKEEYLAAGHKEPAAVPDKAIKPIKESVEAAQQPEEKAEEKKAPASKKAPAKRKK